MDRLRARPVGIVLAGGGSSRMGRDKAGIVLHGETLAGRAAARLAAVCPEVAVADAGRGSLPGRPSLPDGPGEGPAAGILGAARAFPGRPLLVLACDLPGVPVALLAELAASQGFDGAVPRWNGRVEPLCALYAPAALAALEDQVARGLFGPHRLAERGDLAIRFLEGEELARFGRPEEVFANLNEPGELARWLERR
ncbi:MAG TPA: NTP transferase domain-containing protein [Thermoanaerobaculia bacterium]|nr:NTP transferase domain-containing protein [Thermoanaerobaculia bacterium]